MTEDPDIFITGQRVNVTNWSWPGKRSGVIKYLGEVKFSGEKPRSGVLAGVALDAFNDFTGMNDGRFNGKRYFQCPGKMCVFVRLSDLTLQSQPAARQTTGTAGHLTHH